jgi:hypothetical protein
VVHHTAGRNAYTRAEAPAIVKAIQLYHVKGNGWNDIGYNFLVDRFGTVYEGRYGGIDRNVIGAHAQGFNTGSTGVALLGSFETSAPSRAAEDALAGLLAWRLELAYVDSRAKLTVRSSGNPRFAPNTPVPLRTVSGHRDTGPTECPGDALASRLDAVADAVAKIGGPKIFEPRVDVAAEGLVRFRARLSATLPWVVAVKAGAKEIARGTGTGRSVDWTWDPSTALPATYTWSITASSARPATGSLRAGSASTELAIQEVAAAPEGLTPNGDGQGDIAVVAFSLTAAANVTVEVRDITDTLMTTVVDRVWKRAGKHTVTVDGTSLPDGLYSVLVRARTATSAEVVEVLPLTVSRALGLVSATPAAISPNGDGRSDRLEVGFALAAPATAGVRIVREGRWVATPLAAVALPAGPQRVVWEGARSAGALRDGSYTAVVDVTDEVGISVSFGVPFAVDTVAPRVSILPSRPLRVRVSEPVVLDLVINGEPLTREVKRPRTLRIPWHEPVRTARVVARDAAGNASAAATRVFGPQRSGQ